MPGSHFCNSIFFLHEHKNAQRQLPRFLPVHTLVLFRFPLSIIVYTVIIPLRRHSSIYLPYPLSFSTKNYKKKKKWANNGLDLSVDKTVHPVKKKRLSTLYLVHNDMTTNIINYEASLLGTLNFEEKNGQKKKLFVLKRLH